MKGRDAAPVLAPALPFTRLRIHPYFSMKPLICLSVAVMSFAGPLLSGQAAPRKEPEVPSSVAIGVAKIDITPESPILLSGYANRVAREWKVIQPLQARAMAIGSDAQLPVVLLTVDLVGMTEDISGAVAAALAESHHIDRARVAVCVTHTHTGPAVHGILSLEPQGMTEDDRDAIRRYAGDLRRKLIAVAVAALDARRPARLSWGEGHAGFAVNRRKLENGKWVAFGAVPDGPVDRTLPLMAARDEQGRLLGAFVSYACHCTTIGGKHVVHPDWAGEAALQIEAAHPNAVALVGIGCGGDIRPWPGGSTEEASARGAEIAAEVGRLLAAPLRPLGPVTTAHYRRIALPLESTDGPAGAPATAAANRVREEIAKAGPRPVGVPYPVQMWNFGGDLAMIFLAGEVVVDYSLRLRQELAPGRIWINAYANSVPCYIASKRLHAEGGYEVDVSMSKYGWPARLALGTEDLIVDTVRGLVPVDFIRSGK